MFKIGKFSSQSETIELHTPELSITRTSILDYFANQDHFVKIFNWDEGHRLEPETGEFLSGLCKGLAFPQSEKAFIGYITKGNHLINKNYPEFHIYRDISFYLKYLQNCDPRVFPPKNLFSQMNAELNWKFEQGVFVIEAFFDGFPLKCYADEPYKSSLHRFPSSARASNLALPHEINTEDDVLHIKNLPSFKDCLGQQDCELLLSYLTVPYLRIPLVLSLFATEDRVHSLRSEELQIVVDAVLFEPGT
jgi:hypothetical protein